MKGMHTIQDQPVIAHSLFSSELHLFIIIVITIVISPTCTFPQLFSCPSLHLSNFQSPLLFLLFLLHFCCTSLLSTPPHSPSPSSKFLLPQSHESSGHGSCLWRERRRRHGSAAQIGHESDRNLSHLLFAFPESISPRNVFAGLYGGPVTIDFLWTAPSPQRGCCSILVGRGFFRIAYINLRGGVVSRSLISSACNFMVLSMSVLKSSSPWTGLDLRFPASSFVQLNPRHPASRTC